MKIVILEQHAVNPGDLSWERIESLGEVTVYDRCPYSDEREVIRRLADADIVLDNKVAIGPPIIDACPKLKLICLQATGYNVIDCAYARARGITVCNVPGYSTASVGQFTIGLLLELCHHIGMHSDGVMAGRWVQSPDFCYWDTPQIELDGKTIGIIGFGAIGKRTGTIARSLGMRVLATGSRPCDEGRAIGEYTDLQTLLASSDVVALHCPLLPETQGVINAQSVSLMKDGAILLNAARGPLVVEADIRDALESGKLSGYAADVVDAEPMSADCPLLGAPNCIITPHIAWAARECRSRIIDTVYNNICAFLDGHPQNVVN